MKRVIKAGEACEVEPRPMDLPDVAQEARRILADGAREAQRVVDSARRQVAAIRQEAADRGYEEGLSRGREEGLSRGLAEARLQAGEKLSGDLAEVAALARKVVDELASAREQLLQQAKAEMLDLAMEIARKIVGRAAESDVEPARANLEKALELAGGRGNVTVMVHPSQLEALRRHAPDVVEALRFRGRVTLAGDERVGKGGVRLLGRQGEIDATVQTQLANIAEALRGPDSPALDVTSPDGNVRENASVVGAQRGREGDLGEGDLREDASVAGAKVDAKTDAEEQELV